MLWTVQIPRQRRGPAGRSRDAGMWGCGTTRMGRTQVVVVVAQQEAAMARRIEALHQMPRRIVLAAGLLHACRL